MQSYSDSPPSPPPSRAPSTGPAIDHRYYPHIIENILQYIPYDALPLARTVCKEWAEILESGGGGAHILVEYLASPYPADANKEDDGSVIRLVSKNPFNLRTLFDTTWATLTRCCSGERGELRESRFRQYLQNAQVVDLLNFEGNPSPIESYVQYHSPTWGPTSRRALAKILDMITHVPVVRWQGDFDDGPSVFGRAVDPIPRLHGLGVGRHFNVYFFRLRCGRRQLPEPWIRNPRQTCSPIVLNLMFDDEHDSLCRCNFGVDVDLDAPVICRIPDISTFRPAAGEPQTVPPGQPHRTVIIHPFMWQYGSSSAFRVARLLLRGVWPHRRGGVRVRIVGLELLLSPRGTASNDAKGKTWPDLLQSIRSDAMWPELEANITFLTLKEYRESIGNDFVFKLLTKLPYWPGEDYSDDSAFLDSGE